MMRVEGAPCRRVYWLVAIGAVWVAGLALLGCDGEPACVVGATEPCACADGTTSTRGCGADERFGPCQCDNPRMDGGAGADGSMSNEDGGLMDGGPLPTVDGGPTGADGGSDASIEFPALPRVMAFDGDDVVAADFSCMGARTAPTNGASIDFDVQVNDFQSADAVPGAVVQIFDDNVIPSGDDCGDCFEFVADGEGRGTATASAGGWFAVRVLGIEGMTARTLQYNLVPPTGTQTALSIRNSTLGLVPSLVGLSRQAGTGVLMGSARDCNALTVTGVVLRIFLADGTEVPSSGASTEPGFFYYSGSTGLPTSGEEFTTRNGQYGAANLPPSTEPARVEIWGRLEAGGEIQRLGCEHSSIRADTLSIIDVGPLRADGC